MPRTTFDLLASIVEVDSTITTDGAVFIEGANQLVTRLCSTQTDERGNLIHDETSLEFVERYLAAHLYCIRDPRPVSEKAGSVSVSYQSAVSTNFASSHYGQMAMAYDYSGALADWNREMNDSGPRKRSLSLDWLGS